MLIQFFVGVFYLTELMVLKSVVVEIRVVDPAEEVEVVLQLLLRAVGRDAQEPVVLEQARLVVTLPQFIFPEYIVSLLNRFELLAVETFCVPVRIVNFVKILELFLNLLLRAVEGQV